MFIEVYDIKEKKTRYIDTSHIVSLLQTEQNTIVTMDVPGLSYVVQDEVMSKIRAAEIMTLGYTTR